MDTAKEKEIQKLLFAMQDTVFKNFQAKLIPNINIDDTIGVRTPELRKLAKAIAKDTNIKEFLDNTPHQYFEENNLHLMILETMTDFGELMSYTEKFLPYINNWATCDIYSPKLFKKHPDEVYNKTCIWLKSNDIYTIRFGVDVLMSYFMDKNFKPEMLNLVAEIKHHDYYVRMVVAWYFSVALVKQYEAAIPFIINYKLDSWTHNKTIQKAIESYRIDDEKKNYLRKLKIKN